MGYHQRRAWPKYVVGAGALFLAVNATGHVVTSNNGSGSGGPPTPPAGSSGLERLWDANGGNPATAADAACIGEHESSGEADATSSNPDGGVNVGIWQLDTKGKGAGYTVTQLEDPNTNARVAIAGSSDGTDWSAWQTAPLCGL